jgi:hypothetical protein
MRASLIPPRACAARSRIALALIAAIAVACGAADTTSTTAMGPSTGAAQATPALDSAPPPAAPFRFRGLDGREISLDTSMGRNTVLAFLATFDTASQAQARFLSGLEKNHTPRTNCFAVVLDRPEALPLVEAFVDTLSLRYPVAHVTAEQLADTRFKATKSVPTVVILDHGGRTVWQSRGLASEQELDAVLRELEVDRVR